MFVRIRSTRNFTRSFKPKSFPGLQLVWTASIALALLTTGCDNADHSHASVQTDAWTLGTKHDVISQTDSLHLVGTFLPIADAAQKIEVDMTCPRPGTIAAELLVVEAQLVWRQSTKDVVAQGFGAAMGIATYPVSTPVKWRIGSVSRTDDVPQRNYNNDAIIDEFFSLSDPTQWTGTLAVAVTTDHGEWAVERSIDTPNAKRFVQMCASDFEKYKVEKAEKDAEKSAAAKVAADAAHERAAMVSKGKETFENAVDDFWPACGGYQVMQSINGARALMQVRQLSSWFIGNTPLTAAEKHDGYSWKGTFAGSFIEHRAIERNPIPDPRTGSTVSWGEWDRWPTGPSCGEIEGYVWVDVPPLSVADGIRV